jgi:hypothetical protein
MKQLILSKPAQLFKSETRLIEVPHTASVKVCNNNYFEVIINKYILLDVRQKMFK